MAYLKDTASSQAQENIQLSDFCAEAGRRLLKAYAVDNNRFILVEELGASHIFYTFFERETLRQIDPKERHLNEHRRQESQTLEGGYSSVSIVYSNEHTGYESVKEQLFKDDILVFTRKRARYNREGFASLLDGYVENERFEKELNQNKQAYLENFYKADFDLKIKILNKLFRAVTSDRFIMGINPVDLFLTEQQFHELDKDKDFRRALRASLEMQAGYSDMRPNEIYELILRNCG